MTTSKTSHPSPQNPEKEIKPLPLSPEVIARLRANGCHASDWSRVRIHPDSDLDLISGVEFEGDVSVGLLDAALRPGCCLRNALIADSSIGDLPRIRAVVGGIRNAEVGDNVTIENTARISYDPQPACGVGLEVSVLDEAGSRHVIIYPGLSAQSAILMARARRAVAEEIYTQTHAYIDSLGLRPRIGDRAEILDAGSLENIHMDPGTVIHGASRLANGSLFSSAPEGKEAAYIGPGVDADGFILEDARADSCAILHHCYLGQGVHVEKGFTAHDSLFFANCSMENGEACALFAGPYTVSMHKGTLLIGCQTSFMNAGSSTNQSNHMYKLGPVHWGVLERGVKTSSGSYLMLGAKIGAFSLLMGHHKTHPDSSEFPFSYLFGDPQGATVVVPGVMLRSCGLLRDELKWPSRDRRRQASLTLRDRVVYDVLNPVTVDPMIRALATIRPMLSRHADDDRYHRYKGMKLSRASLDRAVKLYYLGIMKYLERVLLGPDSSADAGWSFPLPPSDIEEREHDAAEWIDLAGQPLPRPLAVEAAEAGSVEEREMKLDRAFADYGQLQRRWIAARFPAELRVGADEIRRCAREFDRLVDLDRSTYRDSLNAELAMLAL